MLLPSLFYASELAKGETNDETIKVHFAQRFGAAFDDFMQLDLPGTRNGLDDNVRNLDKFLLYNDPFMGMMDKTVLPSEGTLRRLRRKAGSTANAAGVGLSVPDARRAVPGAGDQGGTWRPRPRGVPHRR